MLHLVPGMTFGRLTVLRRSGTRVASCIGWLCRCECGTETIVKSSYLAKGHTRSCGCLSVDTTTLRNLTHGQSRTKEYEAWSGAKRRCIDPRRADYSRYGGRGIRMCREWLDSFETFFRDMGRCPPGHTIDRIDNAGHYEPGNCRWATSKEQANNRRNRTALTFDGETMTVTEWAQRIGMRRTVLHRRLQRGWSAREALTVPPQKSRHWRR